MRPQNPLEAAAAQAAPFQKLGSAKAQFERAAQLQSDEDAWRAVLDHFPDDRTYTPEAKERLAVLYLKARRLDDAAKLFNELQAMGREDPVARTVGIAGQAVIASLQGNYRDSQRLIVSELGEAPRRDELTDDLWYLLRRAARENSQHLDEQAKKQLQDLFEDEP
jgi:hypothetical protein